MDMSPLKLQREVLRSFWAIYGKDGHKHVKSARPKQDTLEALKAVGEATILWKHNPVTLQRKRKNFNKVKVYRHRFESHSLCFACRDKGTIRHHIVWLSNGGLNSKKNLITLCKSCHAYIHPWLS